MIDSQQASEALSDINEIVRRVRQSRIYHLASLIIIMWGVLVFAGNIASFLAPRFAGYAWLAVYGVGIAGSFAISTFLYKRTGVRTFDIRALAALLLFIAFGMFCCALGHLTAPRQIGTFWAIYCMLIYNRRRTMGRLRVCGDRGRRHGADAGRLFLHRRLVRTVDGGRQWRRADPRRALDAPELTWPNSTTSSINRCGCDSWRH